MRLSGRSREEKALQAADKLKNALDGYDRAQLRKAVQNRDPEAAEKAINDLASRGTIRKDDDGIWQVGD